MECDEYPQKNPNLYITLAETVSGGYLLREDGGLILLETSNPLFR